MKTIQITSTRAAAGVALRVLLAAAALGTGVPAQAITYANWTFNDGGGGDASGNGHDLGSGGPTAASPAPWGGSANCSSNTDAGEYTRWGGVSGDPLPTDNFTLGLWVKGNSPAYSNVDAGRSSLLATNGDGSDSLWIGAIGSNWAVSLGWPGDGHTVLATFPVTPAAPQHVEVTREAGAYSVFLDGELIAGPTAASGFSWDSFHVGINSGGWSHYRGLFGDVLLTDVVSHTPQANITSFGLPGMPAVINQETKIISWTVPYGTIPSELAPTFTMSAGANCVPESGSQQNFDNPVQYTVTSSDNNITNVYTVVVTVTPISSDKDILTFGPPENPAVIDQETREITWTVPAGSNLATLAPPYTVSQFFGGSATGSPPSGSAPDFSVNNPATYTVTAQDGSTKEYHVTVVAYPEWPTTINVNYAGGPNPGNAFMNGIYSFDAIARGGASRVAPAPYSGNTWNDFTNSVASGSNLKDSLGATTGVGASTSMENGPWNDWNGLNHNRMLVSAVLAGYSTYAPIFTLTGLDPGHAYDLYIASRINNDYRPTDFMVGGTVRHLENAGATDWAEGDSYVRFASLIPAPDGSMVVKAKTGGDWAGISVNGFQIQDMGVRGLNSEALFYEFRFPGAGVSAPVVDGTNITVNMYVGSDVTALGPVFIASTGATVTAAGLPVASGNARDFTDPVHYVVTSEDGTTTTDYLVKVNLVRRTGHIHVNVTPQAESSVWGPAPFNGYGKAWNQKPNAKSATSLVDQDGIPTSVNFNFDPFEGPGWWGNPALALIHGGVYTWGSAQGQITGLTPGGSYDLYVASHWADNASCGTFTVNGNSLSLDGRGASGSVWAEGANYLRFLNVVADVNGKITITGTASEGLPLMISGFQLFDTSILSPDCEMLSFGPGATISGTDIRWTVPSGTAPETLAPLFTTSPMATCDQPNGAVPTPDLGSGPVHYVVTAQDGSHSKDYTVWVTVATPPFATGLVCWYDAGAGVVSDLSGVATWSDLSGNGHHATRGNGSVSLGTNQVNSRPAVMLRGGNTYLDCAGAMFTKQQYVVVRSPHATWNGNGSFLGRASPDFLTVRASSYNLANGTTGFWEDHFPIAVSRNGTPLNLNYENPDRCGFRLAPITEYMIVKITVDADGGDVEHSPYPYYQIGKNETLNTADLDIAEIMGFSSPLNSTNENVVGAYLATKYGIASSYVSSNSFAGWASANGVTGGANGDSDHDGIENFVEYALLLDPHASDGSPGTLSNGVLSFVKRAEAVSNGDVRYVIETSPNLTDWTEVLSSDPNLSDLSDTISYALPPDQGSLFARLKVTEP